MFRDLTFEQCMELEKEYAASEYEAAAARDYHAAEHFHMLRWRCMDAAVKVVEKNG